jgi:hypothetical protein
MLHRFFDNEITAGYAFYFETGNKPTKNRPMEKREIPEF